VAAETPGPVRTSPIVSHRFMPVPFLDARLQDGSLREEIKAAVVGVLERGPLAAGTGVLAFESRLATEFEARAAVAVASGCDALVNGLQAIGIGAGDAVLLPALTGSGVLTAVQRAGATPVFVDIERTSALLDLAAVDAAVVRARASPAVRRVAALLVVHLFGRAHDLVACREAAARNDLLLVEEASAASMARSGGVRVGTAGAIGVIDFAAHTSDLAGGAAVLTDSTAMAQQLREACDGAGTRMKPLVAAVQNRALARLEAQARQRFVLAHRYLASLFGRRLLDRFCPLDFGEPGEHVFQRVVVRVARREALRSHLAARGIGTAVDYPRALHLGVAGGTPLAPLGAFPEAERAAGALLALPAWPGLAPAQIDEVVAALADFGAAEAAGG